MITATTKQQHYLKQFAALQFPGSIETHGTIHVLEQQIPREAGDFYPIMEFIQNAGESLLADELFDRFKIKTTMMLHPKEIEALYRAHPKEMQYVACFDVIDSETGNLYSRIKVFCSGYEYAQNSAKVILCNKHKVTVQKGTCVTEYSYPFDGGHKVLRHRRYLRHHRRSRESKIIEAKKTAARRSRAAEDVGNISYIRVAERANKKLNEYVLNFDEM